MCGRYVSPTQTELERYWRLTRAQIRDPLVPVLTVSPTAVVPMLRRAEAGHVELVAARWGLIPLWWKESKRPRNTFNARSEEAATKPMWRYPVTKSRCLVPAAGWYEWKAVESRDPSTGEKKQTKQPYLVRKVDREPIAFAGLMSRRNVAGEKPEFSCTILTRDALGPAAGIYNRMPIALPKDAEAAWLDPELTDPSLMIDFARDSALTEFMLHPVDADVKEAGNQAPVSLGQFPNPD